MPSRVFHRSRLPIPVPGKYVARIAPASRPNNPSPRAPHWHSPTPCPRPPPAIATAPVSRRGRNVVQQKTSHDATSDPRSKRTGRYGNARVLRQQCDRASASAGVPTVDAYAVQRLSPGELGCKFVLQVAQRKIGGPAKVRRGRAPIALHAAKIRHRRAAPEIGRRFGVTAATRRVRKARVPIAEAQHVPCRRVDCRVGCRRFSGDPAIDLVGF